MRRTRRLRITLLSLMAVVAAAAVLLSWAARERQRRIALLTAELRAHEDRIGWAERMEQRGYLPRTAVSAEQAKRQDIRTQLDRLGAWPPR